jgi:hypothetical protein
MKSRQVLSAAVLVGIAWLPLACVGMGLGQAQAFAGAGLSGAGGGVGGAMADTPDGSLYADGTRAVNEGRWADAEKAFAKVAADHRAHADGALYWKAYAENKLGQLKPALDTCAELEHAFPGSSWIHECGALEIEMSAKSGKPVEPKAGDDDDLKLLALNSLMKKNEAQALAQIQEILNGDSSEKLKKEAMFILGNHYSNTTYGQVVRVSHVEGDVRVARGKENERVGGAEWEKAVADLPLETGFSLVTGAGRAEIELEDASTIYLGENSVLSFNDLSTTAGVPYTELALLAGTVTLHVKPYVRGEVFVLKTPTDRLSTAFPRKSYLRVTSYADATGIASMDASNLSIANSFDDSIENGQTSFYRDGQRIETVKSTEVLDFADWDAWVANRVGERKKALTEMMVASGLTTPIPGLAEMKGQGQFFDCAPYGTCWEPNYADDQVKMEEKAVQEGESSIAASGDAAPRARTATSGRGVIETEAFSACLPTALRFGAERDPATGRLRFMDGTLDPNAYPYAWAVCHSGSWVRHRRHYAWVPTHRRHHLPPGRWVKNGKTVAFVPLHPYDVKGRPAINEKEVVFAVNNKMGMPPQPVKLDPGHPIEELKQPPREFRSAAFPPLQRAGEPRTMTHTMKDALASRGPIKAPGIAIEFDHRSGSFLMSKQVMQGGKNVTVMAPINNHGGNLQARGGNYSGGGISHGGASAGGGSHASGGSSGGGASHSGGSSPASSASSASSSAASSSGSHH